MFLQKICMADNDEKVYDIIKALYSLCLKMRSPEMASISLKSLLLAQQTRQ